MGTQFGMVEPRSWPCTPEGVQTYERNQCPGVGDFQEKHTQKHGSQESCEEISLRLLYVYRV